MTINGRTEQTEDNDRIIAEIKIVDGDELICDKKINFAKKAFDAIEDVLEQTTIDRLPNGHYNKKAGRQDAEQK